MKRTGLVLLIALIAWGACPIRAEKPDLFKTFFERLAVGLVFEERPQRSEICQPVEYFQLVPESVAPVHFQSLPIPVQDMMGEISAEKLFRFQVKSLWKNEVRTLYAGVEKGRADGGLTAFDESRLYYPYQNINPKPSACFGDYIIVEDHNSPNEPVELLGYELDVERDDNRETTDVKGYLLVRNNTNKLVAAIGGLINPLSKLNSPLAPTIPYEIQDGVLLLPGQPFRVKTDLKLPSATRKMSPTINCVLFDDGTLWRTPN